MPKLREGDIVVRLFGYRVRIYADRSFVQRSRLEHWSAHGHAGVVWRPRPKDWNRPNGQRVFGIQWRDDGL